MEVSNEIKEDIRKTQTDLKNAIRVHQIWVTRLQDDENNIHLKQKVKDAEKEIIAIGQTQKLVVDRLRRELELYQQRLKSRNKPINIENDNRYVAQQLRDHQNKFRRQRYVSLLKPSVLNEIHIKSENNHEEFKEEDEDVKSSQEKENSNLGEAFEKGPKSYSQSAMKDSRSNFVNVLKKVKESFMTSKTQRNEECSQDDERRSESSSPSLQLSPSPSPPPLPKPGESITQENFMRLLELVTPAQKQILDKKRSERRKRATTSTNRKEFLYDNSDMPPKRKKCNPYPYLQQPSEPPQTRSAKLRKQQSSQQDNYDNKSSREGSPSESSSENNKGYNSKPSSWSDNLPPGVSVEPVYPPVKKVCHGCGRNDVPSLLVFCLSCNIWQHTGCGLKAGRCGECGETLPDPPAARSPAHNDLYLDKLAERKRLQEKNIQLCVELRKLEARAANIKESLDEHNAEKRQLLSDQIKTQRNLQKLLDFISQFKDTSLSLRSSSVSESGSEVSKSNDE